MDWIFEPEDEEIPTGHFEGEVHEAEVCCPQCDNLYIPPTCEVCGMAWFIPKSPEIYQ